MNAIITPRTRATQFPTNGHTRPTARIWRAFTALLLATCLAGPVTADNTDDRYILGYATAILEQQFQLQAGSLQVSEGVIRVSAEDLGAADREKIVQALQEIRGVNRVDVVKVADVESAPPPPPTETRATIELGETKPEGGEFLPKGRLFEPLIADPRWPHFSVSYQRYLDDAELENVGAASLGTTIGVYENDFPGAGRWQAGLQAAVFTIFDLDAASQDLVNADYWLGVPLSYRHKDFSTMIRLFHQSSHLGDEFLLRNRANRVNLSYEGADWRLSYELFDRIVRLYGGGGYLLRTDPRDLEEWSAQGGLELRSPRTILGKIMRPIAGADVQGREETDWDVDFSARAGLQFETENMRDRYLQLMLEYYNGHSPNGQFFDRTIEYWGVGLHFYYD